MSTYSKSFFYLFLIFAIYCSYIVGVSYDEFFHYDNGERRLKYLLQYLYEFVEHIT